MPEDEFLDWCDLDFRIDPTPDDEADLFVLFAEALDPNNDKTVEEARREWEGLL
jgi:hypothetical protein